MASQSINIAANSPVKALERPDLLSPQVLQAGLNDQLHKFKSSLPKPDINYFFLKGNLSSHKLIQIVVCSFVYGSSKTKPKLLTGPNSEEGSERRHSSDKLIMTSSAPPTQNYTPSATGIWPGSRAVDLRNPHTDIDLKRG